MNNIILEYVIPISVKEKVSGLKGTPIHGIALRETVSANGIRYIATEMEKAASTFNGRPLMKNHSDKVEDIVGRINKAYYNPQEKQIEFDGVVLENNMVEMIEDGRAQELSIRASVADLVEETVNGETARTAIGLQGQEISFVAIPGVRGAQISQTASFDMAVCEALKKVNENKMTEQKIKEADAAPAPAGDAVLQAVNELSAKIDKLLSAIAPSPMPEEKAPAVKSESAETAPLTKEISELKAQVKELSALKEAQAKTVDKVEEKETNKIKEFSRNGIRGYTYEPDYAKLRSRS